MQKSEDKNLDFTGSNSGWSEFLAREAGDPYFKELMRFLESEWSAGKKVFPLRSHIFRALQEIDIDEVKVLILGQDPYHGDHQAIGRSFAVPNQLFPKPPSLQNIIKELNADLGLDYPKECSDLSGWSAEGVMLLNTVLTVRAHEAFSHRGKGWEIFTDRVIQTLNEREKPVVFILWGSAAIAKRANINQERHVIIESPHPSPLSAYRGFFGSKPFSRANAALKAKGISPVNWARTSTS